MAEKISGSASSKCLEKNSFPRASARLISLAVMAYYSSSSNPPYPAKGGLDPPKSLAGRSLQHLAGSTTCRAVAPATPKALPRYGRALKAIQRLPDESRQLQQK